MGLALEGVWGWLSMELGLAQYGVGAGSEMSTERRDDAAMLTKGRFGESPPFSIHWALWLNPLKRVAPSIDGHASIHRRGHLYPEVRPRLSMAEHVSMD